MDGDSIDFSSSSIEHNSSFNIHAVGLGTSHNDLNMYCLIPFYMMCISVVPLHAKIAFTTHRLGMRYRSLNNILNTYVAACKQNTSLPNLKVQNPTSFFLSSTVSGVGYYQMNHKHMEEVIVQFSKIHEALRKVTRDISK